MNVRKRCLVLSLLLLSQLTRGQKCEQFDVGLYPQYAQWASAVVYIDVPGWLMGSGFVVAKEWNYANECEERSTVDFYIVTAAHIIDVDLDDFVTEEDRILFQALSRFYFNYETGKTPIIIRGSEIVFCPYFTSCQDVDPITGKADDFAIVKITMDKRTAEKLSPFHLGLDLAPSVSDPFIGIHHPAGAVKKLNQVKSTQLLSSCEEYLHHFSSGHIQGGSSGSPIINKVTGNVSSLLAFANPECGNSADGPNFGSLFRRGFLLPLLDAASNPFAGASKMSPSEDASTMGKTTAAPTRLDGYPYGPNFIKTGVPVVDQDRSIASGTAIYVQPFVNFQKSRITLRAPLVRYYLEDQGVPGMLHILSHSNVYVNTRRFSLSSFAVGPPYPPGSEGYDGSRLYVEACEIDTIKHMEANQNAEVHLKAMNSEIQIGRLVAFEEPAFIFDPESRVILEARDVVINQPLSARGWIEPWDGHGYFKIITSNGIIVNPMNFLTMNIDVCNRAVWSSVAILITNANIIMSGASWRAESNRFSAEQMHLYRDVHADYSEDEGISLINNNMVLKTSTIEQSQSPLKMNTGSISLNQSRLLMSGNSTLSMTAGNFQGNGSLIRYANGYNLIEWSIPGSSHMTNMKMEICGPVVPVPRYLESEGARNLESRSVSNDLIASDVVLPTMNITATSVDLGATRFNAENGNISMNVAKLTISSQTDISSTKNGRVSIKVMKPAKLAAHLQEMQTLTAARTTHLAAVIPGYTADVASGKERATATLAADTAETELKLEEAAAAIPDRFDLAAFPNPFNASTTIRYEIPEQSHVEIKVYDVLGRLSVMLCDGMAKAGQHQVSWKADGAPSGVYYVVCTSRSVSNGAVQKKSVKLSLVK